jgi:hypothetical protein
MRWIIRLAFIALPLVSIQACVPNKCVKDERYRLAQIDLDQGNRALGAKDFQKASEEYLKGVSRLGNNYKLPPTTIDDSRMHLLAAIDDEHRGELFYAAEDRQGVLSGRLSMYRRAQKCSD